MKSKNRYYLIKRLTDAQIKIPLLSAQRFYILNCSFWMFILTLVRHSVTLCSQLFFFPENLEICVAIEDLNMIISKVIF